MPQPRLWEDVDPFGKNDASKIPFLSKKLVACHGGKGREPARPSRTRELSSLCYHADLGVHPPARCPRKEKVVYLPGTSAPRASRPET